MADNLNVPSQREPVLAKWLAWCGMAAWFFAVGLALHSARPVSMTRLNALNVGFLAFVGLFLVWAIFFFR